MAFVWPLPKKVQAKIGKLDQGVDIAAPAHTPLLAVADGIIVRHGIAGFGADTPVLKTNDGQYVYYGHAGPGNRLPDGAKVKAGQVIGEVGAGQVGISTGPHLEIGFADVRGNPIGTSTAPRMRDLLSNSSKHDGISLGAGVGAVIGGAATLLQDPIQGVEKAAAKAAGQAAQDAVSGLLSDLWSFVSDHAKYAAVLAAVVVAGFAMTGLGFTHATGLKGQPA